LRRKKKLLKGKLNSVEFKTKGDTIEVTVLASLSPPKNMRQEMNYFVNCLVEVTGPDNRRYFGKVSKTPGVFGDGKHSQEFYFIIKLGAVRGATVSAYCVELRSTEGVLDIQMKGCQAAEEIEKRNADSAPLAFEA